MSAPTDPILRPAAFLSNRPLTFPNGAANPSVNGRLCPAALRAFEKGELAPEELETFVEALRQLLPVQEKVRPADRFASATEEALDLIARVLNKEPNHALERWVKEFIPFINSEPDLNSTLSHLQNTLALYTAVINLKHGD